MLQGPSVAARLPAVRPGEERFLIALEARAAPRGSFIARVRRRLDMGHRLYQGAALKRPLSELLAEALEECEDIPGWLAQADQVARAAGIPEPRRTRLLAHIEAAAAIAVIADEAVMKALIEARQWEATK